MINETQLYDCMVIGGGPAGLAAALKIHESGGTVIVIERENRLGGILKQCIHDGFGLIRFKEQLTGPEYAQRYMDMIDQTNIKVVLKAFVTSFEKISEGFKAQLVIADQGVVEMTARTIVLATGCRERTSRQLYIAGARPSGIYTAGTAQYLVNIDGLLPCKKCVILGSGDIGLIMARRLTLEGAEVLGVYEAKPEPSGLKRNIQQCLHDYGIPLHLSKTVVAVHGTERLESVVIASVDDKMNILAGTEETILCDGLILSVGLIPENEIAEKLGVEMDERTRGPRIDGHQMTSVPGVFSCGNALKVFDLVDHVSKSGEIAGESALMYIHSQKGAGIWS